MRAAGAWLWRALLPREGAARTGRGDAGGARVERSCEPIMAKENNRTFAEDGKFGPEMKQRGARVQSLLRAAKWHHLSQQSPAVSPNTL